MLCQAKHESTNPIAIIDNKDGQLPLDYVIDTAKDVRLFEILMRGYENQALMDYIGRLLKPYNPKERAAAAKGLIKSKNVPKTIELGFMFDLYRYGRKGEKFDWLRTEGEPVLPIK